MINKDFSFSAETQEEAENWINLLNQSAPQKITPKWRIKSGQLGSAPKPQENDDRDPDKMFPNSNDLFQKFKNRITHPNRRSRRTHHVKKYKEIETKETPEVFHKKEKPIIHYANFGNIPDKFKKQLENIEKIS